MVAGTFTKDEANKLNGSDEEALTTGGVVYYALSTKGGANIGFYWMAEGGAAFANGIDALFVAVTGGAIHGIIGVDHAGKIGIHCAVHRSGFVGIITQEDVAFEIEIQVVGL